MANVSGVSETHNTPEGSISFIVKNIEYYLPVGDKINSEEELTKLEEELKYTRGFLKSVQKKLQNERFVQNAPEAVVAKEKEKQADAESKIAALEAQIKGMG